jgi:hypothetical protein
VDDLNVVRIVGVLEWQGHPAVAVDYFVMSLLDLIDMDAFIRTHQSIVGIGKLVLYDVVCV